MLSMKKKRFQFEVQFNLQELSSVPFVTGVLYAKLRLIDGGQFTRQSPRVEIDNHRVNWNQKFAFSCKLSASASSGILDACLCRVSIRKEQDGGKSYTKLGYADINLAEFAGAGATCRSYLLQSYNEKKRKPDNSIVKVTINMKLTSGDVLFKAATPVVSRSSEELATHTEEENDHQSNGHLVSSVSNYSKDSPSYFPRHRRGSVDSGITKNLTVNYERRSSTTSSSCCSSRPLSPTDETRTLNLDSLQISDRPHTPQGSKLPSDSKNVISSSPGIPQKYSDPASHDVDTPPKPPLRKGHIRASSVGASPMWSHKRMGSHSTSVSTSHASRPTSSVSTKSNDPETESLASNRTRLSTITMTSMTSRVERTRRDPEEVVANLVQRHDLSQPEGEHSENLQLYLDRTGAVMLTGHSVDEKFGHLQRVDFNRK